MFGVIDKFFIKKGITTQEEVIKRAGEQLVRFILASAFRIYKDEVFKKEFSLENLDKVEQDRLFNELELSAFCLLLFVLDSASKWGRQEKALLWRRVRQNIIQDFLDWIANELKIPEKFVSLWEKVIEMRYKEYKESLPEIYKDTGIVDPEFIKNGAERHKEGYARFMAVSIGAIFHLRRGKTSPKDPYFKTLRTWLSVLNLQLESKIFE